MLGADGVVAFGVGAGALGALGPLVLGVLLPLLGVEDSVTGVATCSTVDVTGCVACPTVPPNEAAMDGDVHTARPAAAPSITRMTRDQSMRSA